MLASTIQFTNTHPHPLPSTHAATTPPPPTRRKRRRPVRRPGEPGNTRENITGPPPPHRGRTAGPVPSGPNSAPTPPPRAGPRGPPGPHRPAPTRPGKTGTGKHTHTEKSGELSVVFPPMSVPSPRERWCHGSDPRAALLQGRYG